MTELLTPTPTGILMAPLANLAAMLASSAPFVARIDAALVASDEAVQAAMLTGPSRRIYFPCKEDIRTTTAGFYDSLPAAVVKFGTKFSMELVGAGSANDLWPSGNLRLVLGCDSRFDDLEADGLDVGNWVGAVLLDLASRAGSDNPGASESRLCISRIDQEYELSVCELGEEVSSGRKWLTSFIIEYT